MLALISKDHEVALAFQNKNKKQNKTLRLKTNHWEELIKYHA